MAPIRFYKEGKPMNKIARMTAQAGLIAGLLVAAATTSLAAKPEGKGPNAKSVAEIAAELSDPASVTATSTKELSNIVMMFCDGTVEKVEFVDGDMLQELIDGKWTSTVSGSGNNAGKEIKAVWVKSGSFRSGDGPGYGGMISFTDACGGGGILG